MDKNFRFGDYLCSFTKTSHYTIDNTTALMLCYYDTEFKCWMDYGVVTVCLFPDQPLPGCVFLDINNNPGIEELFNEYGFGVPTGRKVRSGYVEYPEYHIVPARIEEYTSSEFGSN